MKKKPAKTPPAENLERNTRYDIQPGDVWIDLRTGTRWTVEESSPKRVSLINASSVRQTLTPTALRREFEPCENRFGFAITTRVLHAHLRHSSVTTSIGFDLRKTADGVWFKADLEQTISPAKLALDLRQLATALDAFGSTRPETLEEAAAVLGVRCDEVGGDEI